MKKLNLLLLSLFIVSAAFSSSKTIYVKDCSNMLDATFTVRKALNECKAKKATKLVFPKGTYHFLPNLAFERYMHVTNNGEGLTRFLFDITEFENLEIDGQGSQFVFDGYIVPFLINKSKNITVRNLSIDYKRTFHSEGIVVAAYTDSLDVKFSEKNPYFVENNKLMFTGDEYVTTDNAGRKQKLFYPFWHIVQFDALRREPVAGLEYLPVQNIIVKELQPGIVRIYYPRLNGTVGNTLAFNAENRSVSAIVLSDSENVKIINVIIYHAGGMGIVAQRTKDIYIDSVKVTPANGRMVSTTADATHFVHCTGKITILNSTFENQMDDFTNIHGIYQQIQEIISPTELLIKLGHSMTLGFDFLYPNTRIEFATPATQNTYSTNTVKKMEKLNKEYYIITLNQPIAPETKVKDVISSLDHYPEVLIKNCISRGNRGRGVLLGSRAKMVLEDNYFHSHCPAVCLEGCSRFWFEQAGARDLTIRNNVFDNCNYSFMLGLGVIQAGSGLEDQPYTRNVLIENNKFVSAGPCILNLHAVDNVVFKNNKIEETKDYPLDDGLKNYFESIKLTRFKITNSTNVVIKE